MNEQERFKELVDVAKFLLYHDPEMSRDTANYLTNKGEKFIKRYNDFPKLEQENKQLRENYNLLNKDAPWWVKDEPCGECEHNLLKEHDVENCECGCHG